LIVTVFRGDEVNEIVVGSFRPLPFERAEFDRHIQIVREQLGEAKFEELAAEGHAMTMEQAIACALENIE